MNVNPIAGSEGNKPASKAERKAAKFRKELQVTKLDEVDPDQKNHRKRIPNKPQNASKKKAASSIYNPHFSNKKGYGRPCPSNVPGSSPQLTDNKRLPHSPQFWKNSASSTSSSCTTNSSTEKNYNRTTPKNDNKQRSSSTTEQNNDTKISTKKSNNDKDPDEKKDKATEYTAAYERKSLFAKDKKDPLQEKKEDGVKDPTWLEDTQQTLDSPTTNRFDTKKQKDKKAFLPPEEEALVTNPSEKSETNNSPKNFFSHTSSFVSAKKRKKQLERIASNFSLVHAQDFTTEKKKEDPTQMHTAFLQPTVPISSESVGASLDAITKAHIPAKIDNLFTQMVGTVVIMSNKGISHTEVLLNSPAFQGSEFFGSVLVFEKYATAPDSFNIHLIGNTTNQVNAFAQSVAGLYEAFEKGQFSFRIGRLESSYDPDRTVLHRKSSAGQQDGGSDQSDRRNR